MNEFFKQVAIAVIGAVISYTLIKNLEKGEKS